MRFTNLLSRVIFRVPRYAHSRQFPRLKHILLNKLYIFYIWHIYTLRLKILNHIMELENEKTDFPIKILYSEYEYFITSQMARQIGFINGMIDAGLFDSLALPLPAESLIYEMGHKVLDYMANNPVSEMSYLQKVVLGGMASKNYIQQINKSDSSCVRNVLEQVFALVSLSDYWDCPHITTECAEFIALILSVADQQSVRDWFGGII